MLFDYIDPGQTFVTCPNQDVVYGLGFFSLDEEPVVLQVPDFGDRFWVYPLYDGRTDEFSAIGRAYGTKPGFYLMVGPDWTGRTPSGITAVVRSSTSTARAMRSVRSSRAAWILSLPVVRVASRHRPMCSCDCCAGSRSGSCARDRVSQTLSYRAVDRF